MTKTGESEVQRTSATLRIFSQSIEPQEITRLLGGLSPSKTKVKGELRSPRNPKSSKYTEHIWTLQSEEFDNLQNAIESVLDLIEPHKAAFLKINESSESDFFCFFESPDQGRIEFPIDMLTRCIQLNLPIVVDTYSSASDL